MNEMFAAIGHLIASLRFFSTGMLTIEYNIDL